MAAQPTQTVQPPGAAVPDPASNPAKAGTSASTSEPEGSANQARLRKTDTIVRHNVYWALGVGAIPFPIVDFLGLTGVQVKMIKELSDAYGHKFSEQKAKTAVTALLTGLGSVSIGTALAGSLLKLIPIVGQAISLVGVPIIAAALTQATGKVFVMHFESGGTLLDFQPEKMHSYFQTEFEKAKQTVKDLPKDSKAAQA
jgi:uncharacterized protein (DUF697 family)